MHIFAKIFPFRKPGIGTYLQSHAFLLVLITSCLMIALYNVSELYQINQGPGYRQLLLMAFSFIAIVCLALPVNWMLSRRLLHPLEILSKATLEIQKGNYDYKLSSQSFADSPRELYQLCIVFNQMSATVQETMKGFEQANAALRETEKRYRSLVENFLVGVYVFHGSTIVYTNQCFADIFGYKPEDLTGRDILDLVLPEDRQTVLDNIILRMTAKKNSMHYQFHGLKKDGTVVHIEVIGSSYHEGNKTIITGTLIDITERKRTEELLKQSHEQLENRVKERTAELTKLNTDLLLQIQERRKAEEELRQSEATNRALLNSIPDLMLRVRGDGYCLAVKPPANGFKIIKGPEELVGKNILATIHFTFGPEAASRFSHYMNTALLTLDQQCYEFEITSNNDLRQYESRINVCGKNEVLVIIRDITEQKLAELKTIEARDKLARVERLSTLATIASGIAHELNQPLNAIKVTTDSLLFMKQTNTPLTADEIYQDLARISSQVDRINKIIEHMRSFVRQRHATSLEPTHLTEALAGALSLLENQMKRKRIKVILDIPAALPPIRGNITPLEEIFVNLLANAMQALDTIDIPDKQVIVKARHQDSVIIEVSDNGPGISDQLREMVFEPFYTTKSGYNEMGLGLSIVKSLVLSFGGTIAVERNYMGGATFHILLPAFHRTLTTGGTCSENIIG